MFFNNNDTQLMLTKPHKKILILIAQYLNHKTQQKKQKNKRITTMA